LTQNNQLVNHACGNNRILRKKNCKFRVGQDLKPGS
jgi:hypothetical protein